MTSYDDSTQGRSNKCRLSGVNRHWRNIKKKEKKNIRGVDGGMISLE